MKTLKLFLAAMVFAAVFPLSGLAETKSDFDHKYMLTALKTFAFAPRAKPARDAVGDNGIWDTRVTGDIENRLSADGFKEADRKDADFVVAYHLGAKQQFTTFAVNDYSPGFYGRRWGWGPGWGTTTVSKIPYTQSTLVVDVFDAKTKQLVWRGYDTETIDFNKADKTIGKAVSHLMDRFQHDIKESIKTNEHPS